MLRKDTALTISLIAYHDTPVSNTLPSPGELFLGLRINTPFGLSLKPTPLTDQEKTQLAEKRAAHLQMPKSDPAYHPQQPIWFTDDASSEWKPGFIDSSDTRPNSYWIVSEKYNRLLRRNRHDIKPRFKGALQQQQPEAGLPPSHNQLCDPRPPCDSPPDQPPCDSPPDPVPEQTTIETPPPEPLTSPALPVKPSDVLQPDNPSVTRYGRRVKSTKNPDFVYTMLM